VTVSSVHKEDFCPTPELKNILNAAESLLLEFSLNREGRKEKIRYSRVMENLEAIRESLILHSKEVYSMEQALMAAASEQLTCKQRKLLQWLAFEYKGNIVYTVLINLLSEEFGISQSTVRWNLRGLRESGLILAGNKQNKGLPVSLTNSGQALAEYLGPFTYDTEHI
jgi:hypothetical protein